MNKIATLAGLLAFGTKQADAGTITFAANISCGTWTAYRRSTTLDETLGRAKSEGFVVGFLSGLNALKNVPEILSGLDEGALYAWMDNHCAAHPLEAIPEAATILANELLKKASL
jgi:hypothetical protein